jgi:hypothetical protein
MSTPPTEPELPRSVLEEIKSVIGEVHEDFGRSILDTNEELHTFFRQLTIDMLQSGRDINLIVDDFATNMFWMVLIGREHAIRGFGSPLPREDKDAEDLISDDAISQLIDDENDK